MVLPNVPMSDEHKAALAEGRRQGATVRTYLEALESNRPKRGRKRTVESMKAKLSELEVTLPKMSGTDRLETMQIRRDLERQIENAGPKANLETLEAAFVEVARAYGERKGIEFATWREFGVSPATLSAARISRGD
jgi:hypothetical protein